MHKYISKIFKQLTALYIVDRKKKNTEEKFFRQGEKERENKRWWKKIQCLVINS